jgi:hypothetical protein
VISDNSFFFEIIEKWSTIQRFFYNLKDSDDGYRLRDCPCR